MVTTKSQLSCRLGLSKQTRTSRISASTACKLGVWLEKISTGKSSSGRSRTDVLSEKKYRDWFSIVIQLDRRKLYVVRTPDRHSSAVLTLIDFKCQIHDGRDWSAETPRRGNGKRDINSLVSRSWLSLRADNSRIIKCSCFHFSLVRVGGLKNAAHATTKATECPDVDYPFFRTRIPVEDGERRLFPGRFRDQKIGAIIRLI